MRRMSFALTTDAVLSRQKTVTRRLGWNVLKPGDRLLAVDKLRTKNARKIGVIEVVSVRREPLFAILRSNVGVGYDGGDSNPYAIGEMVAEGFPGMLPLDFVELFTKGNGLSPHANNVDVNRIEFRYPCLVCNESLTPSDEVVNLPDGALAHVECKEDAVASGVAV